MRQCTRLGGAAILPSFGARARRPPPDGYSSSDQRRRRPTPVITSSRRKPSAFVLSVRLGLRIGAGLILSPQARHPRPHQPARKVPLRRLQLPTSFPVESIVCWLSSSSCSSGLS